MNSNEMYLEGEEMFEIEVLSELPSEVTALQDVGPAGACCCNSNSCNELIEI
jgi:hypothetical protein